MDRKRDCGGTIGRDQHPLRRLIIEGAVHIPHIKVLQRLPGCARVLREIDALTSPHPKPASPIHCYRPELRQLLRQLQSCPTLAAIGRQHGALQPRRNRHRLRRSNKPPLLLIQTFHLLPALSRCIARQQTLRRRSVEQLPCPGESIDVSIQFHDLARHRHDSGCSLGRTSLRSSRSRTPPLPCRPPSPPLRSRLRNRRPHHPPLVRLAPDATFHPIYASTRS